MSTDDKWANNNSDARAVEDVRSTCLSMKLFVKSSRMHRGVAAISGASSGCSHNVNNLYGKCLLRLAIVSSMRQASREMILNVNALTSTVRDDGRIIDQNFDSLKSIWILDKACISNYPLAITVMGKRRMSLH